jgi:hypothetical protein
MSDTENPTVQPLFRPSKRRKAIRIRSGISGDDAQPPQASTNPASNPIEGSAIGEQEEKSDGNTVVQRIRKPRAKFGLDVSKDVTTRQDTNGDALQISGSQEIHQDPIMMGKKFAPQTGLVKDDLDKHM